LKPTPIDLRTIYMDTNILKRLLFVEKLTIIVKVLKYAYALNRQRRNLEMFIWKNIFNLNILDC